MEGATVVMLGKVVEVSFDDGKEATPGKGGAAVKGGAAAPAKGAAPAAKGAAAPAKPAAAKAPAKK